MRSALKVIVLAVVLYAAVCSIVYPAWWYELALNGKFSDSDFWVSGLKYVVDSILLSSITISSVIIVVLVLALSRTSVPDKLVAAGKMAWSDYVLGRRFAVSLAVLLIAVLAGTGLSGVRSAQERKMNEQLQKSMADTARLTADLNKWQEKLQGKPPLSEPVTFLLLEKEMVESLYGQFEPDLVPYMVIEELSATSEITVGANFEDLIKAEAGNKLFEKKVLEYRKTEKTTERKLRDLLRYFYDKRTLKRYGAVELRSDDLKKLDESTQLMSHKYQLVLDTAKLRSLRDRLLAQQLVLLEDDLKTLHGLIYVEGDWTVSEQGEYFQLSRPFIADVTNPPVCDVKLRKSQLTPANQDLVRDGIGKSLRMVIFGNVLAGMTDKSKVVLVNPIAVF